MLDIYPAPIAAIIAVPPAGGCTVSVFNIIIVDNDTLNGTAKISIYHTHFC